MSLHRKALLHKNLRQTRLAITEQVCLLTAWMGADMVGLSPAVRVGFRRNDVPRFEPACGYAYSKGTRSTRYLNRSWPAGLSRVAGRRFRTLPKREQNWMCRIGLPSAGISD